MAGSHDPGESDGLGVHLSECLAAARGGDRNALERLIVQFYPRVLAYAERQMGARVRRFIDPEAVAQQALVEVLGGPERLPMEADEDLLLRYLYRNVTTCILQEVRKNRFHVGESQLLVGRERTADGSSTGAVTRADSARWIAELVMELPAELEEVVRLCGLEELSYVEAGRRLGLKADAVRKRYGRARELLLRRMGR